MARKLASEHRLAVLVLGAIVLAYAWSLGGGWVWDDRTWALGDPKPLFERLSSLWYSPGSLVEPQGPNWRPLGSLPVVLLHTLLPIPWPHRVMSLFIHLVAVSSVALIACGVGVRPKVAWFAAACFGLHPGASEPVAWISCKTELIPATLTLVGLASLVRGRERTAGLCFALAPFGKEAWLLLPFSLAFWMLGTKRGAWWAGGLCIAGCATYLGIRPLMGVTTSIGTTSTSMAAQDILGPTGAVALRGIELLTVPTNADVFPLFIAAPIAGAFAIGGFLLAMGLCWGRPAVAALLFALPVLAPNALVVPQFGIVADRYYYLLFACLAVAGAIAAESLAGRLGHLTTPRSLILLPAIPMALGLITTRRAAEWRNEESLFLASLRLNPTNPHAATRVASFLREEGRCDEAIPLFRIGLAVKGAAVSGLQACLTSKGRFEEVVALAPLATTPAARKNLVRTFLVLNRPEEARSTARSALDAFPDDAELWALFGVALGTTGDLAGAGEAFDRALAIAPDETDALNGRAALQGADP